MESGQLVPSRLLLSIWIDSNTPGSLSRVFDIAFHLRAFNLQRPDAEQQTGSRIGGCKRFREAVGGGQSHGEGGVAQKMAAYPTASQVTHWIRDLACGLFLEGA